MNGEEIKKQREIKGWTQLDLSKKIGVSLKTITNYETGGKIPISKIELLREILFENNSNITLSNSDAKKIEIDNFINIPVVPVTAHAGYASGYGDQGYIDSLPTIPVIVDRTYKGKYMVFEVEGDSMDDGSRSSLCNGDKILCREINSEYWKSKLHIKDWYFVIVCKNNGIVVKQIIKHDVDAGLICCHSLNALFEDFEIHLEDVAELYNVIKIVDRNTRI